MIENSSKHYYGPSSLVEKSCHRETWFLFHFSKLPHPHDWLALPSWLVDLLMLASLGGSSGWISGKKHAMSTAQPCSLFSWTPEQHHIRLRRRQVQGYCNRCHDRNRRMPSAFSYQNRNVAFRKGVINTVLMKNLARTEN